MTKNLIALAFASLSLSACTAPTANGRGVASPNAATFAHAASGAVEEQRGSATCITVQRGVAGDVSDTRIAQAWPESNYGDETVAFAGKVGKAARRMLLKFDLASIPAGARIAKATVTLHRETCGCTNVTIHKAIADWSEKNVTWTSFRDAFEHEPFMTLPEGVNTEGDYGPVSFDAKDLVQRWIDGSEPNYGMVLAQEHTNTSFATSESEAMAQRPRLDVCFEPVAP